MKKPSNPTAGKPLPSESAKPGAAEPTVSPALSGYVALAVQDLSTRLSLDPLQIETVSATPKVWPNSGLGCQQPGRQYLQVPIDGTLIELRALGKIYRYHSGGKKTPFLCE